MSSIEDENLFKQITEMPMRVPIGARPGVPMADYLRCPACGGVVGQRLGLSTFLISSNKVIVSMPLVSGIWRRCRGSVKTPGCRQVVTLPSEWLAKSGVKTNAA